MSICTCEFDFGPIDFYRRLVTTAIRPLNLYRSLYLRLFIAGAVVVPAGAVADALREAGRDPTRIVEASARFGLRALGVGNPQMELKLRQVAECPRHGWIMFYDYEEMVRTLGQLSG